jgi:hypothetical protein
MKALAPSRGDRLAPSPESGEEAVMGSSTTLLVSLAVASLSLAACGGSPPPPAAAPVAEPVAAPAAKPAEKDDKAAKAAALDALVAGEAKSGACDAGHQAALEKLLADVEAGMKTKTSEDGKPLEFQLVAKRVLPLGSAAKQIEMAVTGKGTEVHVLAFGAHTVGLDVLVGTAAATTLRSPYQRSATAAPPTLDLPKIGVVDELQSDSRQVTIKPGQPIVVKVSGEGCAALVAFLKR